MIIREQNKSKSSPGKKPYDTIYDTDTGEGSCTCRGWTIKKEGKPRDCGHLKDIRKGLKNQGGSGTITRASMAEVAAAVIPDVLTTATTTAKSVAPMLASAMTKGQTIEHFATDQWILEIKWDGHRQVVTVRDGVVLEARSRAGNTRDLPAHIRRALSYLPNGTYDGELIYPGGKSTDVTRADVQDKLQLVLFDVLELMGENVMRRPLRERRECLELAVQHITQATKRTDRTKGGAVIFSLTFPVNRKTVEDIWANGGEGAVLKRITSIYAPGYRTADWVKVKKGGHVTVTVTGFETGDTGIAFGKTLWRDDHGHESSVKTLNNAELRRIAANPFAFVGKRLVLKYAEHLASGAYWHCFWDHWAGEGE